ncbi:low molecular weight protein-tyrosine-phosphatase [Enterococcus sp. LJL98]
MRVLFVCLGNICRSPMAEGLLRKAAKEQALPLVVDSAATSQFQLGKAPHPGTQAILEAAGVDHHAMIARQIEKKDFSKYDYIIGMDRQNVTDLLRLAPEEEQDKIHLFLSVLPEQTVLDVPDPWYTGDFAQTQQMIEAGLVAWLEKLKTTDK